LLLFLQKKKNLLFLKKKKQKNFYFLALAHPRAHNPRRFRLRRRAMAPTSALSFVVTLRFCCGRSFRTGVEVSPGFHSRLLFLRLTESFTQASGSSGATGELCSLVAAHPDGGAGQTCRIGSCSIPKNRVGAAANGLRLSTSATDTVRTTLHSFRLAPDGFAAGGRGGDT
jgi:hypothetical protein